MQRGSYDAPDTARYSLGHLLTTSLGLLRRGHHCMYVQYIIIIKAAFRGGRVG